MDPTPDELLAAAEEGARLAGAVLAERFGGLRTIEFKTGGLDLVTDADRASEAVLLRYLRGRFPTHSILAEESGLSSGADFHWFVDPLDGTTNYSHRLPHFCVSVAVEGRTGLIAGAIYDPLRKELFSAAVGRGAQLNGVRLRVSNTPSLEKALLCTGFPYDVQKRPEGPLGLFRHFILRAQGVRRFGSAALDLAYVACGRFDGFFEFGLKPWDIAAGVLLVREAGGAVMRIDGGPLDLRVGDMLACGRGIEEELRKECSLFLAELGWKPPSAG